MKDFPCLEGRQVALIRAKVDTGHIVDEKYENVQGSIKGAFTIFEDVDAALLAARNITNENKGIECVIYDREKAVLHYIRPQWLMT